MTNQTDLSPIALYQQREHILALASDDSAQTPEYRDALTKALELLRRTRGEAERAERELHTRHYCGICYGEIPQGQGVPLYRGRQHRMAHKSCNHLSYGNVADARKKLANGEHEPDKCYSGDECPLLNDVPTMHPKRSVFSEPH